MKNNFFKSISIIFLLFFPLIANSAEQFNFDITEINITENGNKFIGNKRGKITTNNGIEIDADNFEYDKKLNKLKADGSVKIVDEKNNYEITTKKIIYLKNDDIIFTEGESKATISSNTIIIEAENFEYDRTNNIINAKKNASIINKNKNVKIYSEFFKYFLTQEKIYSQGKTSAIIQSKYNFKSEDVTFNKNSMNLSSEKKTTITDNINLYSLNKFHYSIDKEELKGENILISSNYIQPNNDKFYFDSAIINLKNRKFISKDVKINVHKNIFDNSENDPRIVGISATGNENIIKINKASFTSCKKNQNCTPWSINAKEIVHDKKKREIIYNNALLKIYDIPILYFPKFFHPDPTVDRRSGFLQPHFNNSNILGSSYSIPYFHAISDNKDLTFTPFIFEDNLQMIQNEYREVNKNSNFYANFNFVNNYKSSVETKKNSIFSFFSKFNLDLNLQNFISSELFLNIERVSNDTFLKVFDTNIQENDLKPDDYNNLESELKLSLKNENYNFETGMKSFENLQKVNSDRYEYVLPYYDFNTTLENKYLEGMIYFSSNGENILNNTNVLTSNITNDISYVSNDYISFNGIKNSFNIDVKNLNSIAKNNSKYKSSPQVEAMGMVSLNSSFPLIKKQEDYSNYLVPKISLRFNPSDMKNHNNLDRTIDVNNIFSSNRLGLTDSLEVGRSLSLGIDYRKEQIDNVNKFFEVKLATVLRDREENFIPKKTTLNKKTSNIFGSISNNFIDFIDLKYNFALDNDLSTLESNNFIAELSFNNFTTNLNFVEESNEMGNSNYLESDSSIIIDENNSLSFKTRRNRKINLTEYYDLVYEYKNDCLTAGIKYKKTYYADRDLKPSENIFFTINLIPLTNYEQKIER